MKNDTNYFKKKLEAEKNKIETELAGMSKENPSKKGDWEAIPPKDTDEREPDLNEAADNMEDYEEAFALNNVLEKRLNEIKAALERIEKGNFGICVAGGGKHQIEEERLEANPAATTCIKHLDI